jgi:hypothetical protein
VLQDAIQMCYCGDNSLEATIIIVRDRGLLSQLQIMNGLVSGPWHGSEPVMTGILITRARVMQENTFNGAILKACV